MGLSFLGDVAKVAGNIAGNLTGAGAVLATADVILSGGGSGGTRTIANPCGGTPTSLVPILAARFEAFPAEAANLRAKIEREGLANKDLGKLQAVWFTPDGMAAAIVWKAWGGTNCDISSDERQIQAEATRIANLALPAGFKPTVAQPTFATTPQNSATGSSPFLATTATIGGNDSGGSLLMSLLLIGVATGVLVFVLTRRGGRRR